jgi:hypothetical protein
MKILWLPECYPIVGIPSARNACKDYYQSSNQVKSSNAQKIGKIISDVNILS